MPAIASRVQTVRLANQKSTYVAACVVANETAPAYYGRQ
jgi:hypothetical protein